MKKFLLFTLDIAILFGSLSIMLLLRYGDNFEHQYNLHLTPFSIIFGLWLLVYYIANLYDIRMFRNTAEFYSSLGRATAIAGVLSIAFFYLIPIFGITPRANLFLFIVVFGLLSLLGRSIFNDLVETRFKKRLYIVGQSEQVSELVQYIEDHPSLGYTIENVVNPENGIKSLKEKIQEGLVDIIVISPEAYRINEMIDLFYRSLDKRINFYNLSSFYERVTGRIALGAINQIWFLENLSEGTKKFYEILKRSFDVIGAVILGLISLLLYPFLILAIKLSSSGAIFYRQRRVGQRGQVFEMIKFRTMVANAEKKTGAVWASEDDQRVTRIGRFFRNTRIDELPQLWNILKGDMSFVGPRAERPEFHNDLKKEVPFYEERYLIKPGLTGWAQINFHYGSSIRDTIEKLKYDLYYIKNRSIVLDAGIMLQTIRIAMQQSGR